MKKTPTLLMKELKYIEEEIKRLYNEDVTNSYAPLNSNMTFKYKPNYSYEQNHQELTELYKEELAIRSVLAKFNNETKADGTDLTIQEALVKIGQLKNEIKYLTILLDRKEYFTEKNSYYGEVITNKVLYEANKVQEDLKACQKELSKLQMAIDRTNLTTFIDC